VLEGGSISTITRDTEATVSRFDVVFGWSQRSPCKKSVERPSKLHVLDLDEHTHRQPDLRQAVLMPYFQVIHGPLTLNRMPPKGTRLECRDAGRVLLLWPYAHQQLKEMYPADFSENGMMLPHRHPFGLPFTLLQDGVECAMVVGKAYPLVGGGDDHLL
jgi:hypothetical protein